MYRTGPTIETSLRRGIFDNRVKGLNLGCGNTIMLNDDEHCWYNLDMHPGEGVDVVWNVEHLPLPFPDNNFDFIKASHILEHIHNWQELMKDLHRILTPRGILEIKVPMAGCRAAYADPTHINYFVPESWLHWDRSTNLGFETLKTSAVGYNLKWNEVITHHRIGIDDGVPGNYFTECLVDYEKDGEKYPWELIADELVKKQEEKCQNPS